MIFWTCYGEYKGRKELKPFMRYVKAKAQQALEDKAYRIYVTDSLRAIINNPSNGRYIDMIKPRKVETRTATEIIDHIKSGLKKG